MFSAQNILEELLSRKIIYRTNDNYFISPFIDIQTMETSLGFEHIAIKQKKNICKSRLDADIKSEALKDIFLDIPLIAANMSTVINEEMYLKLRKHGALGIMHRADSNINLIKFAKNISKQTDLVAMSVGIGDKQFDLAKKLIKNGANIICIDIAQGFSQQIIDLAKKIKKYSLKTKVIIGNTVNTDLLEESYDIADAIKVGIAQGYACETKNTAGCTERQFSAVYKFKYLSRKYGVPIISDGGIREPADFTKAIAAGANSVMMGKIFAACEESAAEKVVFNGENKKLYAGMASEYVQNKWRGGLKKGTCAEGGVRFLDLNGTVESVLNKYSGALRSGITYSGATDIKSFQDNAEFVRL